LRGWSRPGRARRHRPGVGVVHQRSAVLVDGPHDGRPADPQVTGHRGDRVGVLADPPAGSARARSVSTARGQTAAVRSVQVRTLPAGSRQRQSRLRHKSTTGRPPIGRSRTRTVRRPWGWPARRSPYSRSPWLWSGPRAATRRHHLRGENLEAVQAEQPGARRTTVLTHLGPPLAGRQTSAS
jgi:hypothetical protein